MTHLWTDLIHDHIMTATVLDREMFSEVEAARLLRLSQSTLRYWLEGSERGANFISRFYELNPRVNAPLPGENLLRRAFFVSTDASTASP
jgi:hypothetical protein